MKCFLKLSLVALLFAGLQGYAQAPQGINYQGVARGLDGQPLAQKNISIRISILSQSSSGSVEYDEVHDLKTNAFGLFTLVIGQGTSTASNFSFIGWTNGPKWLQIELDENGGRNFKLMGSQQLMSVPYALYAERSGNGYQAGQGISISNNMISNEGDGDNDSTNELISNVTLGTDNKLRITDAGGTKETDLSSLLGASQNLSNVLSEGNSAGNSTITDLGAPSAPSDAATKAYVDAHVDGDASASNELQDLGQVLSLGNNAGGLKIENIGTPASNTDAATKAYVDAHVDGDASATNELQNLAQVLAVDNNAGGTKISNLGAPTLGADAATKAYVDAHTDGDASPTNEIQDLSLTGNTLSLSGDATTVNLASYLDNTDNQDLSNVLGNGNNAAGLKIQNLGTPTIGTDAATKAYVDAHTDGDASTTNEIQNLSQVLAQNNSAGGSRITNLGTPSTNTDATTKLYVDNLDALDADKSSSNEIQNLSQVLTQSNSASGLKITDLGTPTANTDATTKLYVDNLDALDGDKSATNEIQDLSLTGNTLSLSGDATSINLAPYLDNTDAQTLNYNSGSKQLSISGGNTVSIPETQNLSQVLVQGNSAGSSTITNLADPTSAQDAATKKYVDDADAVLSSKISTTYAFKAIYNFTHTAPVAQVVALSTDFDDFSVIVSNQFTAPENGIYQFTVSGACNATSIQLQLRVIPFSGPVQFYNIKRQTGYPDASTLNYLDSTILKLSVGDQVDLIATSGLTGEIISGSFFGFKL